MAFREEAQIECWQNDKLSIFSTSDQTMKVNIFTLYLTNRKLQSKPSCRTRLNSANALCASEYSIIYNISNLRQLSIRYCLDATTQGYV